MSSYIGNLMLSAVASLVNLINTVLSTLLGLTTGTRCAGSPGMSLYCVIQGNLIHGHAPFGTASFSNLWTGTQTVWAVGRDSVWFWGLGWAFYTLSIYLLILGILNAPNLMTQRERAKAGLTGLVVTVVLIAVGQYAAMSITQLSSTLSLSFLHQNGAGPNLTFDTNHVGTAGINDLIASIVGLLNTAMAMLVWVLYQFRAIFLDVWVAFFPLAMAMYANDKTRAITKLWWTEWIYQMAIPFGQSVLIGLSDALTSTHSHTGLSLEDVFASIVGTVGMLASATYMRKIVDAVARNFGTASIGHSSGEGIAHDIAVGGALMTGDALGGAAVHMGGRIMGQTVGKAAISGVNRGFANHARQAIEAFPETHAGAIVAGASLDDIMSHHHAKAGHPLPVGSPHTGLETVDKAMAQGTSTRTGGHKKGLGGHALFHSRTASALGQTFQGASEAVSNSAAGVWARTKWGGLQNEGGIGAAVSGAVATVGSAALAHPVVGSAVLGAVTVGATAGKVMDFDFAGAVHAVSPSGFGQLKEDLAQPFAVHTAQRSARLTRLETARDALRQSMGHNALANRADMINPVFQPGVVNKETGDSTPPTLAHTPAMQAYEQTRNRLMRTIAHPDHVGAIRRALSVDGSPEEVARTSITRIESAWEQGRHVDALGTLPAPVREAYNAAFSHHRPAALDAQATWAVAGESMQLRKEKDDLTALRKQSSVFLNDARAVAHQAPSPQPISLPHHPVPKDILSQPPSTPKVIP